MSSSSSEDFFCKPRLLKLQQLHASHYRYLLNFFTLREYFLSMQFSRSSFPMSFFFEELVGSSGLEPPTSRLSGARSNQLSYEPMLGGDERVRTAGLLLARQALSQLSYTPTDFFKPSRVSPPCGFPSCSLLKVLSHLQNYIVFRFSISARSHPSF